ncbi:hypothetical protein CYLTODRAFT_489566 [Cylindrobasidium torrendii FP15055 ss-10]|uniref:F-box domain-containing protein n=1 Tax=Cylindrobasidium torrendii FP15055 ss-10 TaxID=1314674 RepID=A0A0D7BEN6_9AGAR|nr:hypothetical protein CYLTODRAFT_489566 [Cylindrobasidium torrendii FP15055 ss-10]
MVPQDIIDEIIDQLRDEKVTLKTCSLVSTAFLPRTRTHLFSQLIFARKDRLPPAFLSLVGGNKALTLAVKSVAIIGPVDTDNLWSGVETRALAQVSEAFELLQKLSLVMAYIPTRVVDNFCNVAPRILSLSLSGVSFIQLLDADRFIRCLVSLQELRLRQIRVVGRHEEDAVPALCNEVDVERPIHIKSLSITLPMKGESGITSLMMIGNDTPLGLADLETLDIKSSSFMVFQGILPHILIRAKRLRHLVIAPANAYGFEKDAEADIPPRLCTLREISVSLSKVNRQQYLLNWLAQGLGPQSALQEMHLTLFIDVTANHTLASWAKHGDAAMWKSFDRVLSSVKTLRVLHTRLETRDEWYQGTRPILKRMKEFLEEHLHELRTSGVLRCDICGAT